MPACTLKAIPDLVAHVPVDRFTIVDGPTQACCMRALETVNPLSERYVNLTFTLKTPASTSTFMRKLKMADIFGVEKDGSFQFTAIFCNKIVYGVYEPKKRSGWFQLD